MTHYTLYPSKDAAMLALGEWTREVRADWKFLPLKSWSIVNPDLIQPCDRPRLTGARLAGITVRAVGEFARYGERYAGMASSLFAGAWEAPE